MRRAIAAAALAILLALALIVAFISPPAQLSLLDGAIGGGVGASRPGSALPFGTHGQTLDVWRPAGKVTVKRPVLIFWYGGGWAKGDRRAYAFAARAYARSGFVVVMPDYRKVPGIRFPAFLQDVAKVTPSYWLADLGRSVLVGDGVPITAVLVLAAWTVVLGLVGIMAYRRSGTRI